MERLYFIVKSFITRISIFICTGKIENERQERISIEKILEEMTSRARECVCMHQTKNNFDERYGVCSIENSI
jgi:hypothetical protein